MVRLRKWRWLGIIGVTVAAFVGGGVGWLLSRGDELATYRGHNGVVAQSPSHPMARSSHQPETTAQFGCGTRPPIDCGSPWRATAERSGLSPFPRRLTLLASAGDDHTIRLWDCQRGPGTRSDRGVCSQSSSVWPFLRTARRWRRREPIKEVRLWRVADRQLLRTLKGHAKHVHGLAFATDGKTLFSAGEDGTIRLWDWQSGAATGTLSAGQHHVFGLAMTTDGRTLVAATSGPGVQVVGATVAPGPATGRWSRDGPVGRGQRGQPPFGNDPRGSHVKVWEMASGRLLRTLKGHSGVGLGVSFSPDGKVFFTAAADGTSRSGQAPSANGPSRGRASRPATSARSLPRSGDRQSSCHSGRDSLAFFHAVAHRDSPIGVAREEEPGVSLNSRTRCARADRGVPRHTAGSPAASERCGGRRARRERPWPAGSRRGPPGERVIIEIQHVAAVDAAAECPPQDAARRVRSGKMAEHH